MKLTLYLRNAWLLMFTLPWQSSMVIDTLLYRTIYHTLPLYDGVIDETLQRPKAFARLLRWSAWFLGWLWFLAGSLLGAFVAIPLIHGIGFANTSTHDAIAIGIAAMIGILVQLLGWLLMALADWAGSQYRGQLTLPGVALLSALGIVLCLWPLFGVGFSLFRLLTWVGSDQRVILVASVGSLILKMVVIPVFVAIGRSRGLALWMRWLRSGNNESVER